MSQRSTSPLSRSTVRCTLQRFWGVTRMQPLIVFLSVFSSAGYIFLLTFANTYVMALIVDRVQAAPVVGDQVFEVFGPYILALVLVNLVGQILSKLQDYTVYKLEIAGNYHLARLCFDTLSNQSMTFHTSRFGGSLVSQTSRFMSGYTGLVDVTVYSLIPTITSVICTVAALAPVVPTFTVILVCIMVVYIAFVWLMYKRIMPLSAATSAAQNKLSGVLSDAVTNILAVKTCGREDFERDLFDAADRAARDAETVSMHAMMQRNFTTSGLIVITMAVVSVFVAGGNAWFGISAGSLVMIFTYTYNLTMRLNYVSSMMQRINRALGDAAEMTRVLDEPRLVADDENAPELKVTEGAIDFEHLSFAYRDAAAGESVFDDLTLHVAAGQRVGLVGKSGSGKTTLTKLLLRLDDVQGGRVLVDGQDVSRCTQQSLRRQVAYVPQEALLFHRSIRENIAYGRPGATDEQIREAARLANALEFIDRLPRGFDTMVGERGVKLSGGQRQRVAMGRAIVREPKVFLMDEPLSNLDAKLRVQTRTQIAALQRQLGVTTLYVTHDQTEALTMGDRIAVIKLGVLQQVGAPTELYDRPANVFVAGFIGVPQMNFFDAQLVRSGNGFTVKTEDMNVALAPETCAQLALNWDGGDVKEITAGVRPEQILLADKGEEGALQGTVEVTELMGSTEHVHVTAPDGQFVLIIPVVDLEAKGALKAGDTIWFKFEKNATHLFDKVSGKNLI